MKNAVSSTTAQKAKTVTSTPQTTPTNTQEMFFATTSFTQTREKKLWFYSNILMLKASCHGKLVLLYDFSNLSLIVEHKNFYLKIIKYSIILENHLFILHRCGADSMSDSVRLSNLLWPSTDIRLPPICNKASDNHKVFKKFVSDGSFFMVTFQSNNKFDGTGFYASYNFIQSPGCSPLFYSFFSNLL